MTPKAEERTDERLEQLLSVEQRLETRLREAEETARKQIEEARAHAAHNGERQRQELESQSAAEERADQEAQAKKLAEIEQTGAARVAALEAVDAGRVDELARRVLRRLLEVEGGP